MYLELSKALSNICDIHNIYEFVEKHNRNPFQLIIVYKKGFS